MFLLEIGSRSLVGMQYHEQDSDNDMIIRILRGQAYQQQ